MLKLPASALQAGYLFIFKVNCFRSVHLLEGGQWGKTMYHCYKPKGGGREGLHSSIMLNSLF